MCTEKALENTNQHNFEPNKPGHDHINNLSEEAVELVYTDTTDSSLQNESLKQQQQKQRGAYPDLRNPIQPGEGDDHLSLESNLSELDMNSEDGNDEFDGAIELDMSTGTKTKISSGPVYEVIRANGVLVMVLASDEEVQDARETMRQVEDRFNRDRHYPWVILSPQPLSERTQTLIQHIPSATHLDNDDTDAPAAITFGLIPREQWKFPRWIEALKVRKGDHARLKLGLNTTSVAIRQRRRYMSGFLAQHELLDRYEFFWRVDPGLSLFCDIEQDPMLAMKEDGQKFAWSVSAAVNEAGTPGAWSIIQKFKETYPNHIPHINDESFITRESLNEFSACSYNVQNSIGSIDFFRSPAYIDYFNLIDKEGPIYYERWEDDTVITIGLSLLLPRSDIRFLKELGWGYTTSNTGSKMGIGIETLKGAAAAAAAAAAMQADTTTTQILYCPRHRDQNKICHCDPKWKAPRSHLSCTSYWMGLTTSPQRKQRRECIDGICKVYVKIVEPVLLKTAANDTYTIVGKDIVIPAGSQGEDYY
ncbi:alpha 1,2-mannosyltransferase 2.4.1 [Linnemannia zychae]|nr:alpha 1,2-mannosyltransferase 2.4.1 [Linnemannia zychae]